MRFSSRLFVLSLVLALPSFAGAQGISIDSDAFGFGAPSTPERVCYKLPKRLKRSYKKNLVRALKAGFKATRPKWSKRELVEVKSPKRQGKKLGCEVYVTIGVKGRKTQRVTMTARAKDAKTILDRAIFSRKLARLKSDGLNPIWIRLWPNLDQESMGAGTVAEVGLPAASAQPSAPQVESPPEAQNPVAEPPPVPSATAKASTPPAVDTPFVDQELAAERAEVEGQGKQRSRIGPVLHLLVGGGLSLRNLDNVKGLEQTQDPMPAVWGELQLHIQGLFGMNSDDHDLDIVAGYSRRFAKVTREALRENVEADRSYGHLIYRYRLIEPKVGPYAGYEVLRYDVPRGSKALRARYSVVRAGLSFQQALVELDPDSALSLGISAGPRFSLGSETVFFGLDAEMSFELRLPVGFFSALRLRYVQENGRVFQQKFTDRFFDAEIGVGWSI